MKKELKEKIEKLPDKPGVYIFKDENDISSKMKMNAFFILARQRISKRELNNIFKSNKNGFGILLKILPILKFWNAKMKEKQWC